MPLKFWKREKQKVDESKEPIKTELQIECEKYNRPDLYSYLQYVPYFPDRLEKQQQVPLFHSAFVRLYEGLRLEKDNPEEAEKKLEETKKLLEKTRQEDAKYARDAEKILENFEDIKKILAGLWKIV